MQSRPTEFIIGEGQMAARMRAHNWQATSLGPPETWPHSLKTMVRVMLTSRFAMWLGWGPELLFFCNDAYLPTLGVKHTWALGEPSAKVWAEAWPTVGPMIDEVMRTGIASWNEDMLLLLERSGSPEETYHTFSYSPVADDAGNTAGMFCVVTEETQRVISQRRTGTLHNLAAALNAATEEDDVWQATAEQLETNLRDLPFTLTYLFDDARQARLVSTTGVEPGHPAAPETLVLGREQGWPLEAIAAEVAPVRVADLAGRFSVLPTGAWPKPPQEALIIPLKTQGQDQPAGVFIAGLNPLRPVDRDYEAFVELVANQIASSLGNARAYEEARQRAEALAQLDRAKTVFFSNVSHEFRTPLTMMLGPLEEALADPGLDPVGRERLLLVQRNGARLLKLVNSLLDFSRIEAGRMVASYVPTDLAAVTAELASNFRSAMEQAGLQLIVDAERLSQLVYVDGDMWEKIILNLLSNAFKFTFAGEIRVIVRETGDCVQVTVRDTGTGIPAAELPRMFDRFHRIEGARGRSFEGSGIGLALVQELVHMHGGTIAVSSEEGQGTSFVISVPFGKTHLPPEHVAAAAAEMVNSARTASYVAETVSWLPGAAENSAVTAPAAEERAYILLADDNADMRKYVGRLIRSRHECTLAADGMEALEAIRRRRPDLLLTDVMMPRMDGYSLIQEIRREPSLRDLPVIALSARAGEEARIEGLSQGADDYLEKPFSSRELLARIDSTLAIARIRRQMYAALRQSEERFRNMTDHAPVMVWTTDHHGYCTYLSRSWYEFTGQTPEVGLGMGWLEAVHPDDRELASQTFETAVAVGSTACLEYRLRHRTGTYRWAIDTAAPWVDADGNFLGYIGSVIDIAERKAVEDVQRRMNTVLEQKIAEAIAARESTEAQLRHAQKMEAIGKLTGGVAHDFNNLLQIIAGNLDLLSRDVKGNERAEQRLAYAHAGVARGTRLAAQLLAFARRQPLAPKAVNLGRLIRNMDDMLRRVLGEGIEIETLVAQDLWNTLIDPGQVENALLNLAINARDAMLGLGRLTVEAGNALLDDAHGIRPADVAPGEYIMLAVSDTGCGIPEDLIERVFEPFFTTKPEGEGTGLGLSMVYGFVKQSGGHIKLYSEIGRGTTVRLYLPRSHRPEDRPLIEDKGPITPGTETVLVVEDDDGVRATVVAMLGDLGYRVLKASDADAAMAIVESGISIDILFTDVVMPGRLRSPDLARKVKERLPQVAVLFTSGYAESAIVHDGKLDDGVELLSKPYSKEALARKLRQVLRNQRLSGDRTLPTEIDSECHSVADHLESLALRLLLVEDNELIRTTTVDLLELQGHKVCATGDPLEALALLQRYSIDVLMTDLNLPEMSGAELVEQARQYAPHLPVVVVSGYEPEMVCSTSRLAFVRKPYALRELQDALVKVVVAEK